MVLEGEVITTVPNLFAKASWPSRFCGRSASGGDRPAKVLLMAGEPLQEPIVGYGPFVMNNKTQIAEAVRDFNSGRFGQI